MGADWLLLGMTKLIRPTGLAAAAVGFVFLQYEYLMATDRDAAPDALPTAAVTAVSTATESGVVHTTILDDRIDVRPSGYHQLCRLRKP